MLLEITTTHSPATDLGYLLHKHPARLQSFELSFGKAHVFYPEASQERCTAALLLDIDPVGLVRGRRVGTMLEQYVNDRPYVASSFLSVAMASPTLRVRPSIRQRSSRTEQRQTRTGRNSFTLNSKTVCLAMSWRRNNSATPI